MGDAAVLVELGAVVVGLAVLSRVAGRIGMPTVPLYLGAGLAFGEGGLLPLVTAEEFIAVGAEIGLILLLLMLGLQYSAAELLSTLKRQAPTGLLDLALNFLPGFLLGLVLGFDVTLSMMLGGVTYVSSSGIVAKVLGDLGWTGNRETPLVLSILVIEDLVMALYLPLVGALLLADAGGSSLLPFAGIALVVALLAAASRLEVGLARLVFSHSDEALLLTIVGVTILVAGMAESLGISAAAAAFLVGIVLSGPAAQGAHALLSPLRDLFAAIFFAFVGLSIDASEIPPVLDAAALLALFGIASKLATGWIGGALFGLGPRGRLRAAATLVARGEFSIALAGLAAAAGRGTRFEALAVAYVLLLAAAGPVLARLADLAADRLSAAGRHDRRLSPTA